MWRTYLTVAAIVIVISGGLGLLLPDVVTGRPPGSTMAAWLVPVAGAMGLTSWVEPTPASGGDFRSVAAAPRTEARRPASGDLGLPAGLTAPASTSEPRSTPTPRPTSTPRPTRTPTPTPTATPTQTPLPPPPPTQTPKPTATPRPAFDYVVVSVREIPLPATRNLAYLRGRLVDRNGQPVPGARFRIWSDAIPPWVAVEPPPSRADGTVEFAMSRGNYKVRVEGPRSQETSWMLTGRPGVDQMSDWEFVFQTTY